MFAGIELIIAESLWLQLTGVRGKKKTKAKASLLNPGSTGVVGVLLMQGQQPPPW